MPTSPFLAPNRDSSLAVGRLKGGGVTHYVIPGVYPVAQSTNGPSANRDYYYPITVKSPLVVDQMAVEVSTANASNFRIGLYRADKDWQPMGAPLADSGDIDATATGVKTYTPSTPLFLNRGRYLGVLNAAGTPVFRAWNSGGDHLGFRTTLGTSSHVTEIQVSRTYAAFPTPGTAWTTVTYSNIALQQIIVYRVTYP